MRALLLALVGLQLMACSSPRKLYLENPEQFNVGTLRKNAAGLYDVFDYRLFKIDTVKLVDSEEIKILGLLLPGVQVYHNDLLAKALFGRTNDTCFIAYHYDREDQRVGRSAFISIFNLFSREENRVKQQPSQ